MYLLSFPRFWTLSIEWFWFLCWSILNGVTLKTVSLKLRYPAFTELAWWFTSLSAFDFFHNHWYIIWDRAKSAGLVDILEAVLQQKKKRNHVMLNCDGNENSKKKKTTTTTFVISELRFPPHWARGRGGGGRVLSKVLYWQTPPWSSNLLLFSITFLTEEVPLKGQEARNVDRTRMFTKPEWLKSTNLTIFVAIFF